MFRVGITGGIGAGKSVVCQIFRILNIPVYDADSRAKQLMSEDQELVTKIIQRFGSESYLENGVINRSFLADKVFGDPAELARLNSLVHPAVKKDFNNWSQPLKSPYIIKEAALLIETGSYQDLDCLIVVTAPKKIRLERVILRDDHRTKRQIEEIMNNQMSDSKKEKLADFLIKNDESHPILSQVLEIHNLITHKALKNS